MLFFASSEIRRFLPWFQKIHLPSLNKFDGVTIIWHNFGYKNQSRDHTTKVERDRRSQL